MGRHKADECTAYQASERRREIKVCKMAFRGTQLIECSVSNNADRKKKHITELRALATSLAPVDTMQSLPARVPARIVSEILELLRGCEMSR